MSWDEIIKGGSGSDIINGGSGDDFIQGRAGGDFLDGGDGNDSIQGNEGDDYIRGAAGNDFLHGGTGTDTAVYSGSVKDYSYRRNGEEFFLDHVGGSMIDGNDRLISIERLIFADAVIDLTQNNAPIAFNDAASTDEDNSVSGNVLANDFDWEGHSMTAAAGTFNGVYGTLTLNSNGSYTYTPYASTQSLALGQNVTDSFTYTVSDGSLSDTGTLTVTIAGRNDAPTANPDSASTGENSPVTVNVLANDSDVDNGAVLTVTAASAPAGQGSVSVVSNQIVFDPGSDFDHLDDGESANVLVSYSITDEHGATSSSTLTITVNGANDAPVANDDAASTSEDAAVAGNVLANDTDVDGESLTVANPGVYVGAYGTLTLNADGSYSYAPNVAAQGLDDGESAQEVFAYTASDGTVSDSATLTVTVNGANDSPEANSDSASTNENNVAGVSGNVLANDTDVDGETLTVANPGTYVGTYGTLEIFADGSYTYTPGAGAQGLDVGESAQDVFSYAASDGTVSDSADLTITVTGLNDAPVAVDDTNSTDENSPVSGNVLANDTDVDGEPLTVTTPGTYNGFWGTLVLAADGSYTYTPNAVAALLNNGQSVVDVFAYNASDGTASDGAIITITINGLSGVPNANDDSASTTENGSVSGNVLSNDTDAENDPLTVDNPGTYVGTHGTLTLAADGSYTYTPNAGADGLAAGESVQDVFSYTATDGGASDTATLTVTVNGTNDSPTVTGGDFSGTVSELPDDDPDEGAVVHSTSGEVTFNDVDLTDTHSASVTPQGAFYLGNLSLDVDQSGDSVGWEFTVSDAALEGLSEGEIRIQTYTIEIDDGNGGTVTQDVTVTITGAGVGVGPQTVWFIDNSAVGSANLGTVADPYTSIAAFNAAQGSLGGPQAGHTVHLLAGTGTGIYAEADGINLLNGQILVGDSNGSVRPTIVAAAGDGINVAQNNNISGIDIGDTSGADIADSGGSVGNLTISDVGTSGTGQVIDIDQGGTLNVTLNSAGSTASSGGAVDLAGVGGTFTVTGATTIAGVHSGGGIDITGSSVAASFAGGGTVATGATTAVNYVGNGGSLHIGDGLAIVTTSGAGFNASGGGTVTATGDGNSIVSTTGTALSVSNSSIGLAGLTFESISSAGAVNGILLNNTGTTAGLHGGLTVTGNPGSAVNGSGGTITGSTGAGISLTNTRDVSLDQMTISNGGNDGISGSGVVNFALSNSSILNNGNASGENGIDMTGLTGTAAIDNSTITGSFEDGFSLLNSSGTLDSLAITDSTFDHLAVQSGAGGGNGVVILLQNDAVITDLAIVDSTFRNNFSNGILVNTEDSSRIGADDAASGSTDGAIVAGNSFDDNNIAIQFGVFGSSDITVDIEDNTIVNDGRFDTSTAIVLGTSALSEAGSTLNARVEGNVIGDESIDSSGSAFGSGISLTIQGLADVTASIDDNTIREAPYGFGIEVQSHGSGSGTPPASDVTITNNDVDHMNLGVPGGEFALPAIWVYADSVGAAGPLNLDIRGNTVPSDPSYFFLGTMIEVYESGGDIHLVDDPIGPAGQTATEQLQSSNFGTAGAGPDIDLDLTGPLMLPPDLFYP